MKKDFIQHQAAEELINWSEELNVLYLAEVVLGCPKFNMWTSSIIPTMHHYGRHGLVIHTHEVAKLCFEIPKLLGINVNVTELFLSVVFHDYGKTFDYVPVGPGYINWGETEHKRLIHHISRSALTWQDAWGKFAPRRLILNDPLIGDRVLHNILSHHGRREWGSPIMPKTKEAWLLHLCDGISARMNDCDKTDFVNIK